jgi:hypothetical protein
MPEKKAKIIFCCIKNAPNLFFSQFYSDIYIIKAFDLN